MYDELLQLQEQIERQKQEVRHLQPLREYNRDLELQVQQLQSVCIITTIALSIVYTDLIVLNYIL